MHWGGDNRGNVTGINLHVPGGPPGLLGVHVTLPGRRDPHRR